MKGPCREVVHWLRSTSRDTKTKIQSCSFKNKSRLTVTFSDVSDAG